MRAALVSPLIAVIALFVSKNLAEEAELEKRREEEHQRHLESIRAISGGASATTSVADELSKLGGLLEKGLITREEFDAQKRVLLGGLVAGTPADPSPPPVKPQGICPICEAVIAILSTECGHFKAVFGNGSSWVVRPLGK